MTKELKLIEYMKSEHFEGYERCIGFMSFTNRHNAMEIRVNSGGETILKVNGRYFDVPTEIEKNIRSIMCEQIKKEGKDGNN